jgi:hypothetical protein
MTNVRTTKPFQQVSEAITFHKMSAGLCYHNRHDRDRLDIAGRTQRYDSSRRASVLDKSRAQRVRFEHGDQLLGERDAAAVAVER